MIDARKRNVRVKLHIHTVSSFSECIFTRMKALIIDLFPEPWLSQLRALPLEVDYFPGAERAHVLLLLQGADILILNSAIRVDREAIDAAPNLKMVIRAGIGMDHIDVDYLKEKGIRSENTIGANADSVGEQTVGMLLAMRHNIVLANREVKHFFWRREANRGHEVGGKTIGLIGYGHTGQAVARRLQGFRMNVLAYDKYLRDYGDEYVQQASMEDLYREAEILSLHVPLTEETRGMANDAFFDRFHRPITFLNLARGPITDLTALMRALDDGQVLQAALDVLPNEKLDQLSLQEKKQYQSLFARKEVIITPHIGGWSHESLHNINSRIIALVEEMLPVKAPTAAGTDPSDQEPKNPSGEK